MNPPADDFPCNELVEVVTDYLDGALPPDLARRLEEHLSVCPGCASVLEQFRVVLRVSGRLREDDVQRLPEAEQASLMQAFRDWSSSR